ncbi:Family of unknown function (DUF5309) [uncultured Caudovirales phage]|uniref:Uncharacterized protein n=1 Tax=uncultured Caudovirales phage TaxID=2100421 RepID=A0A6J5PRH1_9CAUD|nr:Family of unknown function (DUF5309) [uncultured Caudovirales phage]
MAVTILKGVSDDADILQSRRVIDMDPVIKQLEPDDAPFTVMLSQTSTRPAKSQKVEWLSDQLVPRLTTLAVAVLIADTTITVAASTGDYFRTNDILRLQNGENVKVTGISTDVLTVTRSIGAVAASAVAISTDVIKIGNAAAEGATLGDIRMTQQVANYNYCQIQRDPLGFTKTLEASDLYGGKEPQYEAKKKMMEHRRQIENTLFFGQRDLTTSGSPVGYCGGVVDFISSNITTVGGSLTESGFATFLRTGFRYGSRNKVLFASPLIVSALSSFAQSKLAPPSSDVKSFGVSLQEYRGANGGTVKIVEKRDWLDFSTSSNQIGSWAIMLDMDDVVMRPLRTTAMLTNRQAPDADTTVQEYLTEYSLQVGVEQNHSILRGVTGY